MSNIPQTNTKGLYLTSTGKGSDAVWTPVSSSGGGGSSGITALTGDVTATGSGSVAAHVVKINGSPLGTTTGATVGYVLAWDGTAWSPSSGGTGNATQIQGKAVSATAPTDAQILIYNNSTSTWTPQSLLFDVTTTNTGVTTVNALQGYPLNVTGYSAPSNGSLLGYSTTSFTWSPFAAPTAAGQMLYWNSASWIQTATPGTGQVLVWNGSSYTAQTVLTTSSTATGDLASSLYSNLTVNKLQGYTLNVTGSNAPSNGSLLGYSTTSFSWSPFAAPTAAGQMLYWNTAGWVQTATPGTGQILQWNGSSYIAVTPVVSGTTAAGDLTGTYPNPTIAKLQGNTLNLTTISNGNFLYYSTYAGTNAIISTGAPTGNGSVMYWNGGFWTSSVSLSNGQILQWNGSSYTAVTPILSGSSAGGNLTGTYPNPTVAKINGSPLGTTTGATTGYVLTWNGTAWAPAAASPSGAAGGDLSGTYPNPTVAKIQGMAVSGTTSPSNGSLMYWDNLSQQWLFTNMSSTPGFGSIGNGSILYWDGSKYTFTPSPNGGGNGAVQWNDSLKKYTIVAIAGSTPNNDAWSANPQSTALSVGTSPVAINSVVFNTDTYVYSKFLITFSMGQANAQSASATLSVNIIEGPSNALVANFAIGQALTTTRNTYSGSLVYVPLSPVVTNSTMTMRCNWNTGTGQINFSTLSVVGIV